MLFRAAVWRTLAPSKNSRAFRHRIVCLQMLFRAAVWHTLAPSKNSRKRRARITEQLCAMRPQAAFFVLLVHLQRCGSLTAGNVMASTHAMPGVRVSLRTPQCRQPIMLHATMATNSFPLTAKLKHNVAAPVTACNKNTAVAAVLPLLRVQQERQQQQQQQQERRANTPQPAAVEMLATADGCVDTGAAALGGCVAREAMTYCFSEYRPCRMTFRNSKRAAWSEC